MPNNAERNREMLAAYEAGPTFKQLSEDYGLSIASIGSILTGERHRREVSPDPFYCTLRQARPFLRLDQPHDIANIPEALLKAAGHS